MKSPLNILHLEDDPNDAALVKSALESEGLAFETICVQTRDDFVAVLEHGGIDLIILDITLTAFDGLAAVDLAQARWPDLPVILVSGSLDEGRAINALKCGATDYILKGRLVRLAPAVRRAMREVKERAERKGLEAQLVETQKMEVLGHLTGGVAHDFNNILAVIMGYSDILLADLDPENPLRNHVEQIRQASQQAAGLTRQLLVFSRNQIVQSAVLDLNVVVADLNQMLRRTINENIEMTVLLGDEIGRVKADAGYLGQVLMNLAVNARDAMPNGGRLTIATANATLDAEYAQTHHEVAPGDYVMLSVSDTGAGMTDEVKGHLFEAFFTTKTAGRGTGLGLTTCQTIIKQSGGHITVHSEVGNGTTFKIYFPRIFQPLAAMAKPFPAGPAPRGTETLLVVEDQPSVRNLSRGVLEAHGYEVLTAANGQEGLHVACDHKGSPIRLVITDVIMPQMGGKVMAEWLQATYPEVKILFTSGYTDDAITHLGVLEPGVDFLQKPFKPAMLARKVRSMLDNETNTAFLRKIEPTAVVTAPTQ